MLRSRESSRVERTRSETDTDKFGEAICAFANDLGGSGQPGYLFVGVDDGTGGVLGVKNVEKVQQLLAGLKTDGNMLPPPSMQIETIPEGGKVAVVAIVRPSDRPPVRYRGRVCIRTTARRGYATCDDERILSERAVDRTKTWDLRPCPDATVGDLLLPLFQADYLPQAVSREILAENGRTVEEQLASLRFYDRRTNRPTHAAVLVFGKDPLFFVPGAYVQYVKYAGSSQSTDVLEEQRFTGDLAQVMRGLDHLAQRVARARPVRQPDLSDHTSYSYPPVALHELFMNAVIHRSYESSSTPTSINEFQDRIEILNPGSLYGELAAGGFPGATAYRNPVIAEAAKTLGFVNRFGRGLAVVQAELERNGSKPLDLSPSEHHFLAVVEVRS